MYFLKYESLNALDIYDRLWTKWTRTTSLQGFINDEEGCVSAKKIIKWSRTTSLPGFINDEEGCVSAKKIIIVNLWCIQTDPLNQSPISRVVNVLKDSIESMQVPSKTLLSLPSKSLKDMII